MKESNVHRQVRNRIMKAASAPAAVDRSDAAWEAIFLHLEECADCAAVYDEFIVAPIEETLMGEASLAAEVAPEVAAPPRIQPPADFSQHPARAAAPSAAASLPPALGGLRSRPPVPRGSEPGQVTHGHAWGLTGRFEDRPTLPPGVEAVLEATTDPEGQPELQARAGGPGLENPGFKIGLAPGDLLAPVRSRNSAAAGHPRWLSSPCGRLRFSLRVDASSGRAILYAVGDERLLETLEFMPDLASCAPNSASRPALLCLHVYNGQGNVELPLGAWGVELGLVLGLGLRDDAHGVVLDLARFLTRPSGSAPGETAR